MVFLLPLALLQSSLAQAPTAGGWTALPTPVLCQARLLSPVPAPLASGSHLLQPADASSAHGATPSASLSMATLQKILEDSGANGRGPRLEFFKSASSLLVRGEPAALDAARARILELDRAAEALAIDLDVDLAGTAGGAGAASPDRLAEKRRVLSGDEVFFGERRTTGFVMGFNVEVAADSGIAAPVLGTATYGHNLHLRAVRVDGGRRIQIQGLLDLSDLTSLDRFDPETPDLGILQQPAIDFVQIAFAGVVDSGGTLEVRVGGAALALPDWKLSVKAVARPDDPAATGTLDVLDLACIARDPTQLQAAAPGAELDRLAQFTAPARPPVAIPPAAVAAALDSRAGDSSGAHLSAWWGDDLLILRRSDAQARVDARSLVAAGETSRLASCRIQVQQGGLSATFPVCAGTAARLLAGRERTVLVGYRVEIAPQTWMPAPDVQKTFDGLALDAQVVQGAVECSAWIAKSAPTTVVPRKDAQLGKLQVLSRTLRTQRARVSAGEPERADPGPAGDAVILRCLAP